MYSLFQVCSIFHTKVGIVCYLNFTCTDRSLVSKKELRQILKLQIGLSLNLWKGLATEKAHKPLISENIFFYILRQIAHQFCSQNIRFVWRLNLQYVNSCVQSCSKIEAKYHARNFSNYHPLFLGLQFHNLTPLNCSIKHWTNSQVQVLCNRLTRYHFIANLS